MCYPLFSSYKLKRHRTAAELDHNTDEQLRTCAAAGRAAPGWFALRTFGPSAAFGGCQGSLALAGRWDVVIRAVCKDGFS